MASVPPKSASVSSPHPPAKKPRTDDPSRSQAKAIDALFAKNPTITTPSALAKRTASSLPAPPEIVQNVQGSSAGAGSGEFHVYKASRRREYERLKLMEEEAQREEDEKAWAFKRGEQEKADQAKLGKNQKRRAKQRERKEKKAGTEGDGANGGKKMGANPAMKRKAEDDSQTSQGPDAVSEAQTGADEVGITIQDED